jgi:phage terminase small subunit
LGNLVETHKFHHSRAFLGIIYTRSYDASCIKSTSLNCGNKSPILSYAMTPRQRTFAEQYALDHNGAAAAVRAGYAARSARQTAHDLLTNPNVRAVVAEHERVAATRLALTKERVLDQLQEAMGMAKQKGDLMAWIAALREASKIAGLYAPERKQVQISADGEALRAEFAAMSDEELLALASTPDDAAVS